MAWGYHLIVDCGGCDMTKIKDKQHICNFIKILIDRIDMKAHGDILIENLLPNTNNEGYSVLQMITTSNITCHFVNSSCSAYIDLFSCKKFDDHLVVDTIKEFFIPNKIKINFIERDI